MQSKYWNVLAVDDEPDVTAVTKLALKHMQVFGLPIKVHAVASKQEAVEWFETNPESKALHCVLVDAIMESDTAGLELCEYIRNVRKDFITRIVLRTGQAGKAPEREVVNKYDITSYMQKTDATEEKLFSVVMCCIKEAYQALHLSRAARLVNFMTPYSLNPDMFKKRVKEWYFNASHDDKGRPVPSLDPSFTMMWGDEDDHVGSGIFEDRKQAIEVRDRLLKDGKPTKLNEQGDYVINMPDPVGRGLAYPLNTTLMVLAPQLGGRLPRQCNMWLSATWPIPEFAIDARHSGFLVYRPLYMLAKQLGSST